jgi:predicted transcriptional regulator
MDSEAPGGAGLWDETVHGFRGAVLQRAILARGWTVSDFARAAHVHPASVYNALNGSRVRDSTAIRIFETLEKRQPMSVAIA